MIAETYGELIPHTHSVKIDVLWLVLPSLSMISYC